MTTRIFLIRHGETDWNAAGRWQGHAPVPLNTVGQAQSAALGQYMAQQDITLAALYSSDLLRAMQTAQAVADALGLDVRPDARLREYDLGEWQGLTRAEVQSWDAERYAAVAADSYKMPRPGGESREETEIRMRAAFDAIAAQHTGHTVGLVSHGGSLGMLLRSLVNLTTRPNLTNTSLTIVEQDSPGAAWRLTHTAWTPHLDGGGALGETW